MNTTASPMLADELQSLTTKAMDDLKAIDIIAIDVQKRSSFTDVMLFATGTSTRHVNSIAQSIVDAAEAAGQKPLGVEGDDVGEWVLVDLGDVLVHVMLPEIRQLYELEKLWGEMPEAE